MNRKSAQLRHRDFPLELKKVSDKGTFAGYGSVFGVVDSYKEIVAPGAFADSLAEIEAKGRPLPALWQHRSSEPVGIFTKLAEDERGLACEGQLAIGRNVVRADEAHALMELGAVSGLSIGYFVREDSYDQKTGIRTLKRLELVEISVVTFPANDDARIDTIKSKLAHGTLPSLRQFEDLLKSEGFSKTQAAIIATRGLAHLLDRGDLGEEGHSGKSEIGGLLAAFNLS
jgi:HK97 family phage prohead protease